VVGFEISFKPYRFYEIIYQLFILDSGYVIKVKVFLPLVIGNLTPHARKHERVILVCEDVMIRQ
jgi:hypothetical protein